MQARRARRQARRRGRRRLPDVLRRGPAAAARRRWRKAGLRGGALPLRLRRHEGRCVAVTPARSRSSRAAWRRGCGRSPTTIPKALVEVAGEPFVVHQLELLRASAASSASCCCVGYLGEQVEADARRRQPVRPCGSTTCSTASGCSAPAARCARALPLLGDAFFVLYGDSLSRRATFAPWSEAFRSSGQPGLMTVFRNDGQWDRSNVEFGTGAIVRYDKHER